MTLTALQWRRVAAVSSGAATIEAFLNTIFTLGTAATYDNGDPRVPGTGSAWTWTRFQNVGVTEACFATPPSADVAGLRVILAGVDAGAPTPTMRTPDTFATGRLLASINKNSGAFAAWDVALPFTSGQFFGYWRSQLAASGVLTIQMLESQEAVAFTFRAATNAVSAIILGAYTDPGSTQPVDAEPDGRLYGVCSSAAQQINQMATQNGNFFLSHGGGDGNAHAGLFDVGAVNTIRTVQKQMLLSPAGTIGLGQLTSASPFLLPIAHGLVAAPNTTMGALRNIKVAAPLLTDGGVVNDSGGNEDGYIVAESFALAGQAIALMKA